LNYSESPFRYLTEIMLLGIVSLRAGSRLHYDASAMRVTNNDAANQFLTRDTAVSADAALLVPTG
jgi:hypothetical protein